MLSQSPHGLAREFLMYDNFWIRHHLCLPEVVTYPEY